MKQRIAYIEKMVQRGGPTQRDYEELEAWFRETMADHWRAVLTLDDIHTLWTAFGEAFTPKTMQGFVVRKPHGYHGDWEIIDRIYTHWTSPDPNLRNWDYFFHSLHATKAVRNRLSQLHCRLVDLESRRNGEPIEALVVGCGPARDVRVFLERNPNTRAKFTCFDHDPSAIDYARNLCASWPTSVHFHVGNVVRHLPRSQFDLVWAVGLFDYFSDQLFTLMTRRLYDRLKPEGTLIIGNFSKRNPTRAYMEFGGWMIFHRSEEEMMSLSQYAGIHPDQCSITTESERVNMFLEIRKDR